MSIPGQEFNILDPGLGAAPEAIETPLYMGCCEKGDVNVVYSFSRPSDVVDTLGQGPLSEALCTCLGFPDAGGPVLAIRLTGSVAGALPDGGLLVGGADAVMTLTGTPYDSYKVRTVVTKEASPTPDASVRAATTANISLTGAQTIDGVAVIATNRVLVRAQTAGEENGIYVAAAGAWSRATDADLAAELLGLIVRVEEGTTLADKLYQQTATGIVLGTTPLTFVEPEQTPAEVVYSLDDGYTYTEPFRVPSSGPFVIPKTGLSITFDADDGPFVLGEERAGECTAPHYGTTEIAAGIAAAIAAAADFAFVILTGECATSDAMGGGRGQATAIGSHCETLRTRFQFVRSMVASGASNTADTIADYDSFENTRVLVTYGQCDILTRKPIPGWGYPTRSIVDVIAARACASLISTDLGRVADNGLEGVIAISHDESLNEVMDQKRFATLRRIRGRRGHYITQAKLMSPAGSDYKYWQHGRIMDVACDTTYKTQLPFMNESVRVNQDGTIDARDAARFEEPVNDALATNLTEPNSANGTPGHVTAVGYTIDRTNNLLSSETLKTLVAVRPRGYVKHIVTELGFTANVGGG